jgi:hypothetical protein
MLERLVEEISYFLFWKIGEALTSTLKGNLVLRYYRQATRPDKSHALDQKKQEEGGILLFLCSSLAEELPSEA